MELGCGAAVLSEHMAARGLQTLAIDTVPGVCEAVAERRPDLTVLCADVRHGPEAATGPIQRSFDVVACLGMTLHDDISDHISALTRWGHSATAVINGVWVRSNEEDVWRTTQRRHGIQIRHEWPVSIAEWVHHEVNTLNLVRAIAPGSTLVTRLEAYVDEVLPQLTAEQHFHVFLGTMG